MSGNTVQESVVLLCRHTHHVLKLVSLSNGFLQQLNALGVAAASKGGVCNLQSSKCTHKHVSPPALHMTVQLSLDSNSLRPSSADEASCPFPPKGAPLCGGDVL